MYIHKKSITPHYVQDGGKKTVFVPLLITLVVEALFYYMFLPPINFRSTTFIGILVSAMILYVFVKTIYCASKHVRCTYKKWGIVFTILLVYLIGGNIYSSTIFHAKTYSRILTVEEGEISMIPSVEGSDSIALMDTASAEKLGDRKIGSLSNLVSQFNVGPYVQINCDDAPNKVAALEYAGFFKWQGNRENGVPGYVIVNPVNMSAEYRPLQEGMKYVPSAWFNDNLYRRIRFAYPTTMLRNLHFEIDEEGQPWYVVSTVKPTVGLFGGIQVTGAILANPVTGEMHKYDAKDVPGWVDVVYDGDLICEQYNYHAQLQNGFFNSLFAQTDCRHVTTISKTNEDGDSVNTSDYGYIAKDGDIYVYTGVTSVTGDSSNLGFILSNERTEETRYISCSGADEFSAMKSAEGEVQEKRYTASFPSLINIDNNPTYIMVLKDSSGLVKMYAAVNVEQYNIVATDSTQNGCIEKYRKLIKGEINAEEANGESTVVIPEESMEGYEKRTIKIEKMETIDINGNTWLYVVDENKNVYRAEYSKVIDMILVNPGDTIEILTDDDKFVYPAK